MQLYFRNLHLIHPILDQASFTSRCERDVWHETTPSGNLPLHERSVFLALFNAVLALGAITAGEDALFMKDLTLGYSPMTEVPTERFTQNLSVYLPLKLAKLFFERAKANLGDIFEACSFESTQTLFLMVNWPNRRPLSIQS